MLDRGKGWPVLGLLSPTVLHGREEVRRDGGFFQILSQNITDQLIKASANFNKLKMYILGDRRSIRDVNGREQFFHPSDNI